MSIFRHALLGLVLLTSACAGPIELKANGPAQLSEQKPSTARPTNSPTDKIPHCQVLLTSVLDARGAGDEVASDLGVPIRHEDIVAWLQAGLISSKLPNARLRPAAAVDDSRGKPQLEIELRKAHLHRISTSMSANLVVAASMTDRGGTTRKTIVRGRDTGMNWASSAAEVRDAFDRALQDLVVNLAPSIAALCGT